MRPTSIQRCANGLRGTPRWAFHFTPTSASWLNAVEGFFAKLTRQRLKRGVFRSVVDLQVAINRFVAETNVDPKPFVWTADPKRVLAAVNRGKQTLESVHEERVSARMSERDGVGKMRLLGLAGLRRPAL
jgi:hypothetical protein